MVDYKKRRGGGKRTRIWNRGRKGMGRRKEDKDSEQEEEESMKCEEE